MPASPEGMYSLYFGIASDTAPAKILPGLAPKRTSSLTTTSARATEISKLTTLEIKKSVEGTKVDPKIVSKIISTTTVISSLKDRQSFGSSGYAEQKRMISDRTQKINIWRSDMSKRENKIKSSINELQKLVDEII